MRIAYTVLNTAVVAPIPSMSDTMAVKVKIGFFRNWRNAKVRSWRNIGFPSLTRYDVRFGIWLGLFSQCENSHTRVAHRSLLISELLANRLQLPAALRAGFRVRHFEFFERIQNDPGNDQPRVLLVV